MATDDIHPSPKSHKTKIMFVTGGNVSSLGKGIFSASVGTLLKARGLRVSVAKIDPYLNVDAGTMNPFQHGEVFVTDDGAETDLDLGHYERFIDENLTEESSITTGKVYLSVIRRERKGDYLGATVQVIPHITNEIKNRITQAATHKPLDVLIVEIGGTVGDIESLPFLEAIRQYRNEFGREQVMFVHLTLVPFLGSGGELKTKLTQHSVKELRGIGIQPDMIVCRSAKPLTTDLRQKIALFCDIDPERVVQALDHDNVYELPLIFERDGVGEIVMRRLGFKPRAPELSHLEKIVQVFRHPKAVARVAIVGKYVGLKDSYLSVNEALAHGGFANNAKVEFDFIDSETLMGNRKAVKKLAAYDGILVPGGFGVRGIDGKVEAVRFARENGVPFLGLCLGMQVAVIEAARNQAGIKDANSREFTPENPHNVIDIMDDQKSLEELGGTMRLGLYPCRVLPGTLALRLYGRDLIYERHRHRYEVNNGYRSVLEGTGLVFSGLSPDGKLVEMAERPGHPFFIGVQFHPEFKSRPSAPHPLFKGFIHAALVYQAKRG